MPKSKQLERLETRFSDLNLIAEIDESLLHDQPLVRLIIYDIAGRCVRRLVDGRSEAGAYEVLWDGRSDGGRSAGAGVYFYRLEVGGARLTRKMLLAP
jgi:flagellar hook assembly protein FlgD